MVFGPSAEKRAIAQSILVREFPNCPICKTASGYEVSGLSLDHFKCNLCQAMWQTEPLLKQGLLSMSLVQPSGYDFRGIELTGTRFQASFYKDFDGSFGNVLRNYRAQMSAQLNSIVSVDINEEVVWAWVGSRIGQTVEYPGRLFLTSDRLVWVQNGLFNFQVSLENLVSFAPAKSPGRNLSFIILKSSGGNEGWLRLWLWYGSKGNVEIAEDHRAFSRVREMVFRQQQIKREGIQREKQREQVQVVLDFSSIKETLSKGGIVVTTFKCPQCAGPLDLPETGKQTRCKHCGATVRPVDLFDKIKNLVS